MRNRKNRNFYEKGTLILEIIMTTAIVALISVVLLGAAAFSIRQNTGAKKGNTAVNLAQEAIEAVKNFRDGTTWSLTTGIGGLTVGTAYYPQKTADTPPKWQLVLDEETNIPGFPGFARKIVFSNVNRTGTGTTSSDDIVETGGTFAPDTKKVIVTVTWNQGAEKVEISSYITNWR